MNEYCSVCASFNFSPLKLNLDLCTKSVRLLAQNLQYLATDFFLTYGKFI